MRQKLTPIAIGLSLMTVIAMPSVAATNTDVSSRTQALEQQVSELKREMAAMKRTHNTSSSMTRTRTSHTNSSTNSSFDPSSTVTPGDVRAANQFAAANAPKTQISGPEYLPNAGVQYLPVDLDVPGQSFVSTGPYIGVPMQYNGSDLIVNNPSINQDVALLNLRKNITQRLRAMGLKDSDQHSHLLLSGLVEGQGVYRNSGGGSNSSDIDLSSAGLDAYILGPSTWTTGLISIRYDNSVGSQEGSFSNASRSQNSRVVIDKAFIVLGDYTRSPLYGTLGQMYVPFGLYSTTMISSPLTKSLFRTQTRAALIGFQQQAPCAFYGSAFAFKGDSHAGSTSRVNNGGANLGYKFAGEYFSGNFGGAYIANVADSIGMQNNGLGAVYVPPPFNVPPQPFIFGGFGATGATGSERLVHRVAGWDVRGLFSLGKSIDFLAEYITAANQFSSADATFNAHGARPRALNTELAYTFQCFPKPTSISLGYGYTKDALAFGLPQSRWSTALNTSIWRNTLESIEFRRDLNYAKSATSSGSGIVGPRASGQADTVVTAQIDLFF